MTTGYIVTRDKDGERQYLAGNGCAIGHWSVHKRDAFKFRLKRAAQHQAKNWKGTVEVIDNA